MTKYTYYPGCTLYTKARNLDLCARKAAEKVGFELVEMPRNRMGSQCCGAGGGYKSQYGDLAVNIAAKRVKEAVETGAEVIITTCPFCVLNLQQGAKQLGAKIKVMDLSELLAEVTAPVEAAPAAPAAPAAAPEAKA